MRILFAGLVMLLALTGVSGAAVHHISNGGSDSGSCGPIGQPCQTWEYVRANKLQSGDTVYFRAGDYPSITVNKDTNIPSGTDDANRTIIAGYPGEFPSIDTVTVSYYDAQSNPSRRALTQYVTFRNFKTRGLNSSGCQQVRDGIDMTCGAHYIRWQELEVTNNNTDTCIGGSFGATHLEFLSLHVHHCGAIGNRLEHGFYACNPGGLYDGNNVHDNSGYGMQLYESGFYFPCNSGTIVRNSYIHHNLGDGGVTMAHGDDMQFYNNVVVYNSGSGVDFVYSGNKPDLHNLQVYNNTIYGNNGTGLTVGNVASGSETVHYDSKIRNNIFGSNNRDIELRNVVSPVYTTNMCTAVNEFNLGCTQTGNPAFENVNSGTAEGFKILASSDARNQGATLTTFNLDKAGLDRGQQGSAWDIGAYEYAEGGGPTFDFLVPSPGTKTLVQGTSVTFPVTATLNGGTAQPVSWSVTSLPSGVTGSFTGSPCTPTCTANLTLTATGGAPVGTYTTPSLAGTSGSIVRDTNFTIVVTAPTGVFDFALANPGPQTVSRGAQRAVPVAVSLVSGTAAPVTLSVTAGLPADVTAAFTNNPCTPPCTATLTLTAGDLAPVGTAPLTVHSSGGSQAYDLIFDLTVTNILSTANPIYVRKTAGSPTNSCTAAENQATAKQSIGDACQCMIVPGKVMYIEGNGNTYVEILDTVSSCPLVGGNGPSYDTATRLEGYGTPVPTIQAPVGADMALFLRASGDHYLKFKKLIFDAANQAPNAVAVYPAAHHIRFEEVDIRNTGGGFETFYLTGASNIELVDTFVHDAGSHALTIDASISNFLCQRCHLFSAGQKGLNVNSAGTKTNLTFEALEVRNNTGDGIDLGSTTGTTVQNMINHSNGGIGLRIRSGSSGTRSYNNTMYGNTGVGLQCDAGATTTELRNNIVYGNTAGNIVNNCGATVARNLCAVSSADCAVGGNPLFVSAPSDLHLADGSPAIDAGEAIPSMTTDYSGNPRQVGAQDIGAYERTQAGSQGPNVTEAPCNLAWTGWFF